MRASRTRASELPATVGPTNCPPSSFGASSTPRDTGLTGLQLVKRVLPGRGAAALVGTGVAVGQEEVVGERLL